MKKINRESFVKHVISFTLFFVVGLLLFFPIFSAGFAGDDYAQLVHKPYFHNLSAVTGIFNKVIISPSGHNIFFGFFYRPLPFAIYTTLYVYTHANPFYFHLIQFFLYTLACYLLFIFFTAFFSKRLSLLLSFIFLVHPANEELAAYIASLPDTLCLLFGLAALVILAKGKGQSLTRASLVCIFLLLALFSKETGILIAMLIGIYAVYRKIAKLYALPVIATVCVYLIFRVNASFHPIFSFLSPPNSHQPFLERIFIGLQIAFAFIREIILPTRIAMNPNTFNPNLTSSVVPFFVLCCFSVACVALWTRLKNYKPKNAMMLLLFFVWVILGILFYVQIVSLEVLFAERWLYVAEIGVLGILGVILSMLPLKINRWLILCCILFIILLTLFTTETFLLNGMWHNWQHYFTKIN